MNTNVNIDNNINKGINSLNEKKKKKKKRTVRTSCPIPTPNTFLFSCLIEIQLPKLNEHYTIKIEKKR